MSDEEVNNRAAVYVTSRPSGSPFEVRVSGVRKKELERMVGHKVISRRDGYSWDFLITDDDAVRLGLLTEQEKINRRITMGVPITEAKLYYWEGTELKKREVDQ